MMMLMIIMMSLMMFRMGNCDGVDGLGCLMLGVLGVVLYGGYVVVGECLVCVNLVLVEDGVVYGGVNGVGLVVVDVFFEGVVLVVVVIVFCVDVLVLVVVLEGFGVVGVGWGVVMMCGVYCVLFYYCWLFELLLYYLVGVVIVVFCVFFLIVMWSFCLGLLLGCEVGCEGFGVVEYFGEVVCCIYVGECFVVFCDGVQCGVVEVGGYEYVGDVGDLCFGVVFGVGCCEDCCQILCDFGCCWMYVLVDVIWFCGFGWCVCFD